MFFGNHRPIELTDAPFEDIENDVIGNLLDLDEPDASHHLIQGISYRAVQVNLDNVQSSIWLIVLITSL